MQLKKKQTFVSSESIISFMIMMGLKQRQENNILVLKTTLVQSFFVDRVVKIGILSVLIFTRFSELSTLYMKRRKLIIVHHIFTNICAS